ncbi:MAG TPA: amino acid adenylation domain-containing protein, partial [Ktedonobacteraceae bacterium]|nr:amino acid adenylation domain-containing protein [Ktedonobacteraceae bacterium]
YLVLAPTSLPAPSAQAVEAQMRAALKQRLPDYMMPRYMVLLPELPRTSNGKIDRLALPLPSTGTERGVGDQDPPCTPLEQEIATIWARVLHIDPPGRAENFFEIGGHSLTGFQIIARIREQFKIELPLRQIFETPTVEGLAHILSQSRSRDESAIQLIARDQALPLSFAQQRLWVLEQLNPGTATYNIPLAVRLSGPLDKHALIQSLQAIVARHETLRTTFQVNEGTPTQLIHELPADSSTYPIDFTLIDARDWAPEQRGQLTHLFIQQEASRPFDLTTGPLIRAHLLWLDDTKQVLLLTLHHIISDGWSLGVLARDLGTFYQAFHTGTSPQLPVLPIQYVDYAAWQRQRLQEETLASLLHYWKEQLAELPTVLTLPTDRARPPRQTFNGSNYTFTLSSELTEALRQIGQGEGATLFMTLLATFQILLCRYSGQEDIVVATPIANRSHVDVENLIGFFINTLVLRTNLRGNPSFRTLLQRVRTMALDAYLHQDVPFEQIVQAVQPERDMAYAPLCQVAFQLQNLTQETLDLPDITLQTIEVESTTTKFDLTLSINKHESGLSGEFEYNSDLFDRNTIVRMTAHFQRLLASIALQPEQQIWQLPMLEATEFQQIVLDWNRTEVAYTLERTTSQLVEVWAEQAPAAPALIAGNKSITYRELNRHANQLARYLQACGLQRGDIVGIYQERTIAMIVSLLAVFKAGGAYLPMDPAYPADRLAFMLKDSQATLLLTQETLAQKLAPLPGLHQISVDRETAQIALEKADNLQINITGNDMAYVIYTSGSTGLPKGVAIQHRSLLNLIHWHQRAFSIQPVDRGTHLAGLGFDASVWELWPYLTAGARVYLADNETRIDPQQWQQWIKQHGITISFLPTPLVEQVLALDWSEQTPLRILLTGGDQLHHYPTSNLSFRLVNNYGPTENTVVATSAIVPVKEQFSSFPSIGQPIDNTQIYVLDQELQPQPVGVPGELYIGGTSLALGYLRRPELTAERFVPDPFSPQPGARLYRTGDLVRYLAD